jgi:hypothetical protein
VYVGIRADGHIAVVVAVQIGDLAQKGDGIVAGGEAFGLPSGGDGILLDLVALGGIKRHVRPP